MLKTIKYNPRDLKGLKNILPKANYEEQHLKDPSEKLQIEDLRGGVNSCKPTKKEPEPSAVNDQKLKDFLEKRRIVE